ncbi:DUF421 domain-containing protein [Neobacillus pocheonensis]|uniref:DUF421 domain-containing protein n=1 Tax=Neobacillus pocheonensis TaxID=363869 RepID=A0ABT0WDK5_9BACI|nr:DUF421 domain-containing protein [Neobacillus pocheonensis]
MIVGLIDIKSRKFPIFLDGQPSIIIKQGKIMEHELKKMRLDMDELNLLLRTKDVYSIEDVNYAIFEKNGELSVL